MGKLTQGLIWDPGCVWGNTVHVLIYGIISGIDIHLDTNIGKRLSALGSTLTSFAGEATLPLTGEEEEEEESSDDTMPPVSSATKMDAQRRTGQQLPEGGENTWNLIVLDCFVHIIQLLPSSVWLNCMYKWHCHCNKRIRNHMKYKTATSLW